MKNPNVNESVRMTSNGGNEDFFQEGDIAIITKVIKQGEDAEIDNEFVPALEDVYFIDLLPESPFAGITRRAFEYPISQ